MAATSMPDMLVILNDNQMSISENVGALPKMLARLMTSRTLNAMRERAKNSMRRNGFLWRFFKRWEEHLKGMFVPSTLFEEFGFHYFGPIDGHDLPMLLHSLKTLKNLKGPQLLHVITTKGKGYEPAEREQIEYHAVGPFDPVKGIVKKAPGKQSYTEVFGDWLCDMAAAMSACSRSRRRCAKARASCATRRNFRDATSTSASPSSTRSRSPPAWPAKTRNPSSRSTRRSCSARTTRRFTMSRSRISTSRSRSTARGVVGPDGATHAGSFDLTYLRCVPNLVVAAPADENECRALLTTAFLHDGPAAVRYPRGTGPGAKIDAELKPLPIGKAEVRRRGSRLAILAFGSPLTAALAVGEEFGTTVVNMRFVKPLDEALIVELARTHDAFVTVEDNAIAGGAGGAVAEFLSAKSLLNPVLQLGLPDAFLEHASREQLLAEAGIDAAGIRKAILARWPQFESKPQVRSAI